MKNIGILGSGEVAQTLGAGFIKNGYKVCLGTGHTEKLTDWTTEQGGNAQIGSFADAAKFGDLVVLAVKGDAALTVLESAGKDNLKGKTIIDTSNPIEAAPPVNGVLKFFTNINESLMEQLQKAFPEGNFVKAFNSIGAPLMINPDFGATKPTMFICGNNEAAKKEVAGIDTLFGFETEDMGQAEAARAIEPLCLLWCITGFTTNKWAGHA
ncbi:MAG: NADPH-dependent F420 reductase, partial [Candidatus Saccharimonadales bacterium]